MATPTTAETRPDLRCSSYSRAAGIDPIGTAGSYRGYLLVEWPLPWPRDLTEVPELAPVATAASAAGLRLQGLVARAGAERAVVTYVAPPGPFRSFTRRERTVGPDELAEAAIELAESSQAPVGDALADDPASGVPLVAHDVLICTHGRRDRCCGALGTELAEQLADELEGGSGRLPVGTRLWRTSHTGGHRFAPTAVVLPEGTVWGLLDADRLVDVMQRREPASDVLASYRGCSGLPTRELQALERAALAELGWEVLDAARSGSVEALDEPGWSLARIELTFGDGRVAAFAAEVGVGRRVPIPDCGAALEQSYKTEQELGLRRLRRTA